ncbi:Translation elongation factor EF1B, beta/delta chain, conserved site, partial [Sesbania bispinosa]
MAFPLFGSNVFVHDMTCLQSGFFVLETVVAARIEKGYTFIHSARALKSLDDFLSGKAYISGDQFTKDDIKVYAYVLEKPGGTFPNAAKWYDVVSSHLAASFPGNAQGAASADDDDDLDLFGDETEEDKKAAEEREAAKKPAKKKE